MKIFLFSFLLASVLLLDACVEKGTRSPNVLVIIADDLGWKQLACYGGPYNTPAIDALAEQGIRFTNAYASAAVCSPTRAALMTGKYPARLHLTDFIKGQVFPDSLLAQPQWQKYLPLEEITLAEVFQENAYRTALFGKWHLSQEKMPPGSEAFNPDKNGFDEFMITYKPSKSNTDPEHDPHNVDSITRRAVRFLRENANDPFFLVVSHNAIHDPVMESTGRIQTYKAMYPESNVKAELGAMVERLDQGCEVLLRELEALDLVEETIVVFCSDNGGKETYASQDPLRKGKGWLYEGGIRVPLIIRWPGQIKPGSTFHTLTSTFDLYPGLISMAGLEAVTHPIDGISLADEILGNTAVPNRTLFWHYPHYHFGTGMKPASAMRSGKYKLLEWHEEFLLGEFAWELYDLESDQGELSDLSREQPELLDSLKRELHNWRNLVGAQMPYIKK